VTSLELSDFAGRHCRGSRLEGIIRSKIQLSTITKIHNMFLTSVCLPE